MTRLIKKIIVSVLLTLMTTQISAAEIIAVVHKSNPLTSISENELSNIFLGNKTLWGNDQRISVGMLSTSNENIESFISDVLHKTIKRYNSHWMKHVFSGSGIRPKQFYTNNSAMHFVTNNKDSIALIEKSKIKGNVKRLPITK